MKKEQIVYRQASLQDEPLIADFYLEAFFELAEYKYPARFQWMNLDNPFHTDPNFLPIWLAIHDGQVVGIAALMPQEFSINGNILPGAWCCDLRVLPEYRGMGIGIRLDRMRQEFSTAFSVTSSKVSRYIKKSLGYSSAYSHTLFLKAKSFDNKSLYNDFMRYLGLNRSKLLHKFGLGINIHIFLSLTLLVLLKFKQRSKIIQSHHVRSDLNFVQADTFPREIDELWDQVKHRYSLAVKRDSLYLNWKFVEQPNMNYQRYLVYQGERLCGVLVFRMTKNGELPIGIISELYTSENTEILSEILHFAFSSLNEQGALMIQSASSTDESCQILRSFGFILLRKYQGVFHLLPSAAGSENTITDGKWMITLGDHDLDEPGKEHHPSLFSLLKAIFGLN